MRRFLRVLWFALLVAIVLFAALVSSPGLADPPSGKVSRLIDFGVSIDSPSSNSSSCAIAITMTGMVGDPGDLAVGVSSSKGG